MYSVPPTVRELGSASFSHSKKLEALSFSAGFTNLPWNGFWNCASLESLFFEDANPQYSDLDGVVFNKDGTHLVRCPPGRAHMFVVPEGTTEVDSWAFYHCKALRAVQLPSSIRRVSNVGFSGCDALRAVLFLCDEPDYFSPLHFPVYGGWFFLCIMSRNAPDLLRRTGMDIHRWKLMARLRRPVCGSLGMA